MAKKLLSFVVALLVAGTAAPAAAQHDCGPTPLRQAHAHNDYEHTRPLFDALAAGFTSVEADVYLVDGQLLVGHDRADLKPERTLRKLYLDPLAQRIRAQHGTVFPRYHGEFQLLIDIKTDGENVYRELDKTLRAKPYAGLFTHYRKGHVQRRAVTAVLSGDRPRATLQAQQDRFAFYDGRILDTNDLGPGSDARMTPLVSDNWASVFSWNGTGEMPADQRRRLRQIVTKAHAAHQQVRFWNTPDASGAARTAVWKAERAAGVDYLNTDDLTGLRDFLLG